MNEKINQWLAFIDDYDREMVKVAEEKNDKLKKARIEMNYLTGEAETRRLAELREKWEMDRVSAINHATRKGKEERRKERKNRNSQKTIKIKYATRTNNRNNRTTKRRN